MNLLKFYFKVYKIDSPLRCDESKYMGGVASRDHPPPPCLPGKYVCDLLIGVWRVNEM